MTKRQRVINALDHKKTDFTPWSVHLTQEMHKKLIAFTENPDIIDTFDNHIVMREIGKDVELKERPGFYKDLFNVVWNRKIDKDIGIVDRYLLPEADISLIEKVMPDVPYDNIIKNMEALNKSEGECFRVMGIGFSLFERAWTLRGMDNLLMDMVINSDFVEALLDAITEWNIKCIEYAQNWDYDGFYFGDDWGMQNGLIMGPVYWRKFIKPRLRKMYLKVKEKTKYILQHSCGDIHEIYPDLVELGLSAHQTFQPEIYDIEQIKKQYKGRLAFWGGISTQNLLPFADPDTVAAETRRIIKIMGNGGGFIAAPTHAVPGDVPAENILSMLEVFKSQKNGV